MKTSLAFWTHTPSGIAIRSYTLSSTTDLLEGFCHLFALYLYILIHTHGLHGNFKQSERSAMESDLLRHQLSVVHESVLSPGRC